MARKTDTQWKPGQSGNPTGRPPRALKTAKLRADIEKDVPAIIAKLVEQAKAGDAQSARLLLERVVPAIKPVDLPTPLELPDGTLTDQAKAVLAAAGLGAIPAAQAAQLISALGSVAKLVEVDDFAKRIAALEAQALEKGQNHGNA